jgi:hypothetical protein
VARRDISRLQRRTSDNRVLGILVGFGIGFGVTVGVMAADYETDDLNPFAYIYGAAAGVFMAGVGTLVSGPRWAEFPLDRMRPVDPDKRTSSVRVRVFPVVGNGRRGAAVSVSF